MIRNATSAETAVTADGAYRVLVVDDDPIVRRLLARVLRQAGYDVTAAAKPQGGPFDLIVTNHFDPQLRSEEIVTSLRALFPSAPIIHLDSLSGVPAGSFAAQTPMLRRPFSVDVLLETVRLLLAPVQGGERSA
jgi:CheY-like chemotaxis protein